MNLPNTEREALCFLSARMALGRFSALAAQELADRLIGAGIGGDAVLEIIDARHARERRAALLRLGEDAGVAPFTPDRAVWWLLGRIIGQIARGELDAHEGMQQVMAEVYYPGDLFTRSTHAPGDSHGLERLVAAHYAFEDLSGDHPRTPAERDALAERQEEIRGDIRELACEWLARHVARERVDAA